MAFILCIETATECCSVAVVSEDAILSLCELNEGNMHASMLTSLIEQAIKETGITLAQLDAIAISKGPGSYTGLRVGMSTAKGLCYALNKPLIAVGTLQALAHRCRQLHPETEQSWIVPMIDARRMEVYCSVFDEYFTEQQSTAALIIDEHSFVDIRQQQVVFTGNGAAKCESILGFPNAKFLGDVQCSAAGMHQLAVAAFQSSTFEDVAYVEPFYLKDFVGTTPKKRG